MRSLEPHADTYTIPAANASDAGSYSVRISNSCSQIDSDAATLGLLAKPSILVQPAGQTVCDGSPVTFSVQASDSEPLAYQWSKDGIEIFGATSDTYTIPVADAGARGSYSVRVSNSCSQIVSDSAVLDVSSKPQIKNQSLFETTVRDGQSMMGTPPSVSIQPSSQTACQGSAITLIVEAEGAEPMYYQWMKDGQNIPGAVSGALTITDITAEQAGEYNLVAANCCGSAESNIIRLNIEEPLKLVVIEPKCQIVREGESATFEIKDLKGGPFSYQWEKNAQLIPGANSATYIIQNVSIEDAGGYRLIVSNSCCSIKSNMVVLKVTEAAPRCVCPTPPKPPKNFINYTDYQNIEMGCLPFA